ncbi:MAG: isochorismate synthase [candidate division KSB1 bacterium]|nr:isochorismate synthase [candidate division KSB1 bacterium]
MTFTDLGTELLEQLKKKLMRPNRSGLSIGRVEVPVEGLDLLHFLNGQKAAARIFWSKRDQSERIAAIGAVHHLISNSPKIFQTIHHRLATADDGVRYFGGMRFDPSRPMEEIWQPFAKYHFILPRFELVSHADGERLAMNFLLSPDTDSTQLYRDCRREVEEWLLPPQPFAETALPAVMEHSEIPNREAWEIMVNSALDAIRKGDLIKIVLAGKTMLRLEKSVSPWLLLDYLLKKNGRTFHFALQFNPRSAFIGMSPECLFERRDSTIFTEAVAATRPRGFSDEEDERLALEMRASDKDQREHRLVQKMILEKLTPLCRHIEQVTTEQVVKLTHVQHLVSEFSAELRKEVTDGHLILALHPTPAVGGLPGRQAIDAIAQLEPFDRGWYAAPLGWISRREAEFAVAIRSALVYGDRLEVYAGSGIVEGSDPQKEWDEKRNKTKNFMQLFGLE